MNCGRFRKGVFSTPLLNQNAGVNLDGITLWQIFIGNGAHTMRRQGDERISPARVKDRSLKDIGSTQSGH